MIESFKHFRDALFHTTAHTQTVASRSYSWIGTDTRSSTVCSLCLQSLRRSFCFLFILQAAFNIRMYHGGLHRRGDGRSIEFLGFQYRSKRPLPIDYGGLRATYNTKDHAITRQWTQVLTRRFHEFPERRWQHFARITAFSRASSSLSMLSSRCSHA
jgi:hypothetical protein